jgi:Flp pilus assembly CpaF family ATPase
MPRVVGGVRAAESRTLLERWATAHPGEGGFVRDVLAGA